MQSGSVVAQGSPAEALTGATLDRLYPGDWDLTFAENVPVVLPKAVINGRRSLSS